MRQGVESLTFLMTTLDLVTNHGFSNGINYFSTFLSGWDDLFGAGPEHVSQTLPLEALQLEIPYQSLNKSALNPL